MGVFRVPIEVGDPDGERFEPVEALVDTGASYSTAPGSLLRALGVEPQERRPFLLADGRTVERDIGQTWLRINGRMLMTIMVFGDEGTDCLLGAVTLEEFGLGVDPVGRKLTPVPSYLMAETLP